MPGRTRNESAASWPETACAEILGENRHGYAGPPGRRHLRAVPPLLRGAAGEGRRRTEVGATRGRAGLAAQLLEDGATHVGVATDHVIESFRNDLCPGYKTGAGIDPVLLAQFHPLEEALVGAGLIVWPMVEFEADDALAAAAAAGCRRPAGRAGADLHAGQGPGAVRAGDRVVQFDRRASADARRGRRASRSSACRPRRSPTTWRWSATPPTASPACPAGARSRRRRCWRATATSTPSPIAPAVGRDGARRRRAGGDARRAARPGAAVPHAGHAAADAPPSPASTSCAGAARRRSSSRSRPGSASRACSRGRRRSPRASRPSSPW